MTPAPLTGLESHGGASEGIKGGVTTVEDERGPGLEFQFVFCVRQSSVRGCRFSVMFVYLIIKVIKCSPVPASFFPYLSTSLQSPFDTRVGVCC